MKYLVFLLPIFAFASVSQPQLIKELRNFVASGKPNRIVGSAGHLKAKSYLVNELSQLGGNLEVQEFLPDISLAQKLYQDDLKKITPSNSAYVKWNKFTQYMVNELKKFEKVKGQNIVWYKKAAADSKEWLILMAHYDSISHNKDTFEIEYSAKGPGADYNGTGVASLVYLLKTLKSQKLKKNLLVLFPDYHSFGYLGAHHFVTHIQNYIPKDHKIAVFNLEMLGHDTETFDKTKKLFNYKVYTRKSDEDKSIIDLLLKYNDICKGKLYFDLQKNNFDNSDHMRFWQNGYSAVTFSQNWEDDFNANAYQSDSDIVETINQESFFEAFKYISCLVHSHVRR